MNPAVSPRAEYLQRSAALLPEIRQLWAAPVTTPDVAIAVVTTSVEIFLVGHRSDGLSTVAVLLIALAGGLLVFRRSAPWLVLIGTAVLTAELAATGSHPGAAPLLVALGSLAERREPSSSLTGLVAIVLLLQAGSISSLPIPIGAWALGAYLQMRNRYTTALGEHAADLERQREQLSRLQQERVSIARELHDTVAHSVTVMLIGIRGARDALYAAPEIAQDTLHRVEISAEQSIAALERIPALLDPADPAQPAPAQPAAQPSRSQPSRSQSTHSQPSRSQSTRSQPSGSQPAPPPPAPPQPAYRRSTSPKPPVNSPPTSPQPMSPQPMSPQPAYPSPAYPQPAYLQPTRTEEPATEPGDVVSPRQAQTGGFPAALRPRPRTRAQAQAQARARSGSRARHSRKG